MIRPADLEGKTNLKVLTNSEVKRILFNHVSESEATSRNGIDISMVDAPESNLFQAVGVEYFDSKTGKTEQIFLATSGQGDGLGNLQKIILTAGAINTPKILMASGIGNCSELERQGIDCILNNQNVGKNLQDHPAVGMIFLFSEEIDNELSPIASATVYFAEYIETVSKALELSNDEDEWSESFSKKFGPYASTGFSSGAFLVSPYANSSDVPDIQLTVFPHVIEPHIVDRLTRNESEYAGNFMLITVALLETETTHEVKVDFSRSIDGETYLELNHLTPNEIARINWGISKVRQILSTEPMSSILVSEIVPGAAVVNNKLDHWILSNVYQSSHFCGSVKMGKSQDKEAVLDEHLFVKGVSKLMVADASVIPTIPNGNTHSTVIAIAESISHDLHSNSFFEKY